MREYGREYAESTLRHPSMGRCKHGNYTCEQCRKESIDTERAKKVHTEDKKGN